MNEEAIPLTWINEHIAWLEGLDDAFSTLTAINIKTMVKIWKEENERINKEHEDRISVLPSAQSDNSNESEPPHSCKTCKYNALHWYEEPCDSCTGDSWRPYGGDQNG